MNVPATNPFLIRIPRMTKAPAPVRMPDDAVNILVHLEPGAEAVVFGFMADAAVEVVLEEGARLELLRVAIRGANALRSRQAKDSSLRSFFFTRGGVDLKDAVEVILEGSGAEVFLNGLHCLEGNAFASSYTRVDHAAPSTVSDQLYKSVVRDRAHSVFNGRILVERDAQQTNSYQLNKNLLLSPGARAETVPQLEIFADDVKCSHGATVGQMDQDQVFYLQTRGIDRALAGEMLVMGFMEDVIGRIHDPMLLREVQRLVEAL